MLTLCPSLLENKFFIPGLRDLDGGSGRDPSGKIGIPAGQKDHVFIFDQGITQFFMLWDRWSGTPGRWSLRSA